MISEFEKFMNGGAVDAAGDAGEDFEVSGTTCKCVLDEREMDAGVEVYGDTEEISARLVVPVESVDKVPQQKDTVTRMLDGTTWTVLSVSVDAGQYDLLIRKRDA